MESILLEDNPHWNNLSAYDNFTGGNIQNIKKKASIDYIIDGNKANITKILELCKDEKLENEKQRKIGFC